MGADRAPRFAAAASLLAVLVTWNAVFDRGIDDGVQRYLQQQHERVGRGAAFVYVQDVMCPAAAASAARASAWSAPVAAAGLAAVWWLDRRTRNRRARR